MITFRETPKDRAGIDQIMVMHGGIDQTAALRLAVEFTASGSKPTDRWMLPPKEYKRALSLLQNFHDLWEVALKNFYPRHLPNESEERRLKVDRAHELSSQALNEFGPELQNLRLLRRLTTTMPVGLDLAKVMAGAEDLRRSVSELRAWASDPKLQDATRQKHMQRAENRAELVKLLEAASVLPPSCDQIKDTE